VSLVAQRGLVKKNFIPARTLFSRARSAHEAVVTAGVTRPAFTFGDGSMLAYPGWMAGILALAAPLLWAADEPQRTADTGNKFALVIGVRQYEKSEELSALRYTENDAHQLADVLKQAGYKVVVLSQKEARAKEDIFLAPTARNIRRELDTLLDPDKHNPSDTVLIAFSGHGMQLKGQKEHYFCPQDADLDEPRTLVALGELYQRMDRCTAGMKLLLADSCRNDPGGEKGAKFVLKAETKPTPQQREKPGGVAAFFSCSAGQVSYESDRLGHGLFFHFLIEGFKGKAANPKGQVTLEGLAAYVKSEVDDKVKDVLGRDKVQVPHLVSDVRGNVALTATTKPDPPPPECEETTTLRGTICCAKCALKQMNRCATLIVVREGCRETLYWFDAASDKEHHLKVCHGARRGEVKGTVKRDGDRMIVSVQSIRFE
jgi:hypothetical protein